MIINDLLFTISKMSLLNARSSFQSNFTVEECSRDDEEAEEVNFNFYNTCRYIWQ